jgi:hypothetical protein
MQEMCDRLYAQRVANGTASLSVREMRELREWQNSCINAAPSPAPAPSFPWGKVLFWGGAALMGWTIFGNHRD